MSAPIEPVVPNHANIDAMLHRHGAAFPGLMDHLVKVARAQPAVATDAAGRLAVDWPQAVREWWALVDPQAKVEWPAYNKPADQLHRAVAAVLKGLNSRWPEHLPSAIEQAVPGGEIGLRLKLRSAWLAEAARRLRSGPGCNDTLPMGDLDCSVRLLLDAPNGAAGQFGVLSLRRVEAEHANLALVAAPGSAFTPCTRWFSDTLERVTTRLRLLLPPDPTRHTALAWDIYTPGETLVGLDGPSAGAAITLAALWLLQAHLPPGDLRQALYQIDAGMLLQSGISAELSTGGALWRVGAIGNKVEALRGAASQGEKVHVFVHDADAKELVRQRIANLRPHGVDSVESLAKAIGRAMPPELGWRRLLDLLPLQRPSVVSRESDCEEADPVVPEPAALRRLPAVRNLMGYALHRWATLAKDCGTLRLNCVPLSLVHSATGSGEVESAPDKPLHGLEAALKSITRQSSDQPAPVAILLRGGPGMGKSTLLAQHEMAQCLDFLRRWRQPAGEHGDGAAAVELPLYVSLHQLGADVIDPVAWLRRRVDTEYPHCADLHRLMCNKPLPAQPGLRVRLLLDGLDRLPVPEGMTRTSRARHVVSVLTASLPELPPLICTRTHHQLDRLVWADGVTVDLQPWDRVHVQRSVSRWFFGRGPLAETLLRALDADPDAMELCRTPFNAGFQCELWELYRGLVSQRSGLRRLLRSAFVRELAVAPDTLQRLNPVFHDDALLTQRDRELLLDDDAWQSEPPAAWPGDAKLLRVLFNEALATWGQAGGLSLPAASDTRPQTWLRAVRALGLLQDPPDNSNGSVLLRFCHRLWHEYLASEALLPPLPDPDSAGKLAELRDRLSANRDFIRSPEDELVHQQSLADECWRIPGDAFWKRHLEKPLPLGGFATARATLLKAGYSESQLQEYFPGMRRTATSDWQEAEALDDDVVKVDGATGNCHLDLKRWGELHGVSRHLGSEAGASNSSNWTERPEAWRALVMDLLPEPVRELVLGGLDRQLVDQLRAHRGDLPLRPPGELDRILGLALLGLPRKDCQAWLAWLIVQDAWQALELMLSQLQRHLEGAPMDAWRKPDPVLQHLRRVLLLRMLDAGRAAEAGVRVSGQLGLMPESIDGLPPELGLTSHWTSEWARAFARTHDRRDGRDIRERLQAGRMLGALGDTLRYELAPAAGGEGLRLKSELWATVGTPVSATAFGIGSPFGERGTWPDEQPLWSTAVPKSPTTVLQVARLPVTRAEWHRFVQAGGYDLNAPHWKGVRPAADDWLRCGSVSQAAAFSEVDRRLDLDPMTGITLFEALAYAAWSAPMYEIDNPDRAKLRLRLRLPTEVEWEASQRARPDGRPVSGRAHRLHAFGQNGPQRMDLNHVRTGWGQPSPVGVFSKANSPGGLADGLGNVWEWCVNSLPGGPRPYDVDGSRHEAQADWDPNDASSPRALRGGSYHSLIEECRPASRYQARPNDASSDVGMRLIRLWQPLETLPNRKSE